MFERNFTSTLWNDITSSTCNALNACTHWYSDKHVEVISNNPYFKRHQENEKKLKHLTPVRVKAMHDRECLSRAANGYSVSWWLHFVLLCGSLADSSRIASGRGWSTRDVTEGAGLEVWRAATGIRWHWFAICHRGSSRKVTFLI